MIKSTAYAWLASAEEVVADQYVSALTPRKGCPVGRVGPDAFPSSGGLTKVMSSKNEGRRHPVRPPTDLRAHCIGASLHPVSRALGDRSQISWVSRSKTASPENSRKTSNRLAAGSRGKCHVQSPDEPPTSRRRTTAASPIMTCTREMRDFWNIATAARYQRNDQIRRGTENGTMSSLAGNEEMGWLT